MKRKQENILSPEVDADLMKHDTDDDSKNSNAFPTCSGVLHTGNENDTSEIRRLAMFMTALSKN